MSRERERGVLVERVTETEYDGLPMALLRVPGGPDRIINTEGVSVPVQEGEVWSLTGETVDLADFIRVFGARLENNFHIHHRLVKGA